MTGQPNVVILHGKPPRERYENPAMPKPHLAGWIGWAAVELGSRDYDVSVPAINEPYLARYADWERVMNDLAIGDQTTLIGHSYGAGAAVRWLQDRPTVHVDRLVLVAPWMDPNDKYIGSQMDFEIDRALPESCQQGVDVFYDAKDGQQTLSAVDRLWDRWHDSARFHMLPGYGHFLMGNTMQSPEFSKLIDTVAGSTAG